MPGNRGRQRGFSMIEALVALAIAAGVITAYSRAVSTSLELERRTRARGHASLLAHDLIDRIGFEIPLEAGVLAGRDGDGFTWQLTITEGATLVTADGRSPSSAGLRQIDVSVAGPELPGGYRITTLRVRQDTLR